MTRRSRILAFGSTGLLVLAGVLCAILVADGLGQTLALVLIGIGLVGATSLVFFEVGLSEDHERTREEEEAAARLAREGATGPEPRSTRARPRWRLRRMRGESRRLDR